MVWNSTLQLTFQKLLLVKFGIVSQKNIQLPEKAMSSFSNCMKPYYLQKLTPKQDTATDRMQKQNLRIEFSVTPDITKA